MNQPYSRLEPLGVLLGLMFLLLQPVTVHAANVTNTDIVSASSGQCATVNAYSTVAGTALVQWPCGGVAEQR